MSLLVTSKDIFPHSSFPLMATTLADRPLMQTEFHRHEFFEMLFVAQGAFKNELSTETMELRSGDLLIIKPYVRHILRRNPHPSEVRAYCCSFTPRIVDSSIMGLDDIQTENSPYRHYFATFMSLAEEDTSAILIRVEADQRKQIESHFEHVIRHSGEDGSALVAHRRCQFMELLATLSDLYAADGMGTEEGVTRIATSRYHLGLRKALNHIHDHIDQPLSLQQMAEMSGVSVSYFSMLMKQATGMSFVQYLSSLRMDRACALLRGTSTSVTDICYQVGFNDYSHFSRGFKKWTGFSPRQYRQIQES